MKYKRVEVNPFTKKMVEDTIKKKVDPKIIQDECAKNFMWFVTDGVRQGLSVEVSYTLAKQHFTEYGKAMQAFAEAVDLAIGVETIEKIMSEKQIDS